MLDSSPRAVKQTIFEARASLGECDEGRDMACAEIQRMLSDADGRVLRGRRVRAHLRSCRSCRQFKAALAQRPSDLALLAPPLPAAAGAALLTAVGGGAAATAGAGAAAWARAPAAPRSRRKIVAIVTVTATAAGGTVAATEAVRDHDSSHELPNRSRATARGEPSSALVAARPLGSEPPRPRRRQPAGRGALDRPARRKSDSAAEKRPPGAASSPSHVSRPERARGRGRPDRPAPPAGKPREEPHPVTPRAVRSATRAHSRRSPTARRRGTRRRRPPSLHLPRRPPRGRARQTSSARRLR